MDEQSRTVEANSTGVAATVTMNDATVITLSANEAFDNEYVLSIGYGIVADINPGSISLRIDPALVMTTQAPVIDLSTVGNYADDTAAAAAGVPKGGFYLNGSVLQARVT